MLSLATAFAGENNDARFVMNFDLIVNKPASGELHYSIQQQGIRLLPVKPFHGDDLGEIDYFLTVSEPHDGRAKLTIEFYQFETRRKESEVVSEVVAEVEFTLGTPARFEGNNEKFGVDFAFSIDHE